MLRVSLLDAIVRKSKIADEARRETHESQALLVAELNHRVKNIFALTRSLLRQSRIERGRAWTISRKTVDQRLVGAGARP